MRSPQNSDSNLSSPKIIIANIITTIIGGFILAYILQDARFSPDRTLSQVDPPTLPANTNMVSMTNSETLTNTFAPPTSILSLTDVLEPLSLTTPDFDLETATAATLAAQLTPTPNYVATQNADAFGLETAVAATLTAQPTFTPNHAATQSAAASGLETAVAATLTAQSTPTPTQTSTETATSTPNAPSCSVEGVFSSIWDQYKDYLRCNKTNVSQGVITYEPFENGYLVHCQC